MEQDMYNSTLSHWNRSLTAMMVLFHNTLLLHDGHLKGIGSRYKALIVTILR